MPKKTAPKKTAPKPISWKTALPKSAAPHAAAASWPPPPSDLPPNAAGSAWSLPRLVEVWMEILPAHLCGQEPCDGASDDGPRLRCATPTAYALCGRYDGVEGLINSWTYCPQHAEECAAQEGLPWPPTQLWQDD